MYTKTFITACLLAIRQHVVCAASTWPAPTDELEDLIFLSTGYRSTGLAGLVTPCSKGLSSSRVTAAEWLRTAFHDAISGNIFTGLGGLDGSIAWEIDTLENEGVFADDSVKAWANFVSDQTSLSDVIAAATYAVTRSCSNISIAVRGGRVDATQAGPVGFVPQPQNAVTIFRNQFARMGLDDQGMVQFVACGHTIGGVHVADHPEITDKALATFDKTPYSLDNSIAVEYMQGTTNNPLVVGQSVANRRNSDFKVFSGADRNVTISALAADREVFDNACKTIFQKMIDQVPSGVVLSDPVTPYEVKPYGLQLTLLDGGSKIRFTGDVRVRSTRGAVSQVQLTYTDRNRAVAQTPIDTTAKGIAAGFDDSFDFFGFSTDLPADTSISSFNVVVTYGDSITTFDNNGSGFQVQDAVIYQAPQSCLNSDGQLTVVAAVRDAQDAPNLQVMIKVPQASPNPVPSISTTTIPMATQSAVGSYGLYAANLAFSPDIKQPPVFGIFGGSVADTRKGVSDLATSCATLATPTQSSSSSSSSASGDFITSSAGGNFTSSSISASASSVITPTPSTLSDSMTSSTSAPESVSSSESTPSSSSELTPSSVSSSSISAPASASSTESTSSSISSSSSNPEPPSSTASTSTTPSPTGSADYAFEGCYYDPVNPRALTGKNDYNDEMTIDLCATSCSQFHYFGVEYGRECYCGNELNSLSTSQSLTDCAMPCGGSSTRICGGPQRISLYTNSKYSAPVEPSMPGYEYKGCYSEGSNTRALLTKSFNAPDMTVEQCASLCTGIPYFGVEYSQECYCGTTLQSGSVPQPASDCNMLCAGNKTQYCGGPNRLSLYLDAANPVSSPMNPPMSDSTYQGCYTDSVNARVLIDLWTSGSDMTVQKCANFCARYAYFGTEYSAECYCGDVLKSSTTKVEEAQCGMSCAGNMSQVCGSGDRLSVYLKDS
ncbi:heme peroxidase [Bimuria novae-zelandiae CBS 107.79]|uniref:Heme peroxidase n=1 Tax=Bimuria novae-zelandiae CBS 107.79 TaxID=1447943 RepID=A0A6A5UZM8_9PLEO|nr:heme peroxidase [Bimuria novae-zelandiae CBS 107.79]